MRRPQRWGAMESSSDLKRRRHSADRQREELAVANRVLHVLVARDAAGCPLQPNIARRVRMPAPHMAPAPVAARDQRDLAFRSE